MGYGYCETCDLTIHFCDMQYCDKCEKSFCTKCCIYVSFDMGETEKFYCYECFEDVKEEEEYINHINKIEEKEKKLIEIKSIEKELLGKLINYPEKLPKEINILIKKLSEIKNNT